ncbi:MAG: response regulator [Mesosutterella sp.]|nr:response regulator [Mesosutterella sp.]
MELIASMLAHELRQPLVVITNYAQGLRIRLSRSPVDRGILLSSLDEIEAAGERADEIVEHVRNFVKGWRSSPVELDLGQEVEKIIRTFKRHCSSGIAVSFEASPRLSVRAGPVELGIIFMNLLRNSEEACRKNDRGTPGRIAVRIGRRGERSVVRGQDNGPRLTDEALERMQKLGRPSSGEGLGLGLGITRELAEGCGGSVGIERCEPQGAAGDRAPAAQRCSSAREEELTVDHSLAVIRAVDDETAVRHSWQFIIESAGWSVRPYASAEAFLNFDDERVPGCVILDIQMPGMSGIELQKELAARSSRIPVIFATAHGDIDTAVQALKDGAADFLPKPVKAERLLPAIEKAVEADLRGRESQSRLESALALWVALTPREEEVARGIVRGELNKQVADRMDNTEKTSRHTEAHCCSSS